MDFLTDIGRKITGTAKTVTKKSEDIVEITKLNLAIGNEEDRIKRLLYEIGSDVYKSYTEGKPLGGHFDNRCSEIKELETGIQKTKEKILKLKGHKTCESCKSIVDLEVRFCPNCGAKVEEPVQEEEKTE